MAVDRNELILKLKVESTKANAQIERTNKNFKQMRVTTAGLRRSIGVLRNNLLLVSFAFAGITASIGAVVRVSSRFEAVKTRLVGLTGSVEGAEKAFRSFNEIAATTPFTLDDVVSAGAQLEAFGADSNKLLKEITDLAAFMGTTATEAANAFGRAYAGGAGAADILRERGILNIVKESQKLKDLSKTTLPEFRKALIESLQDPAVGIEGSTDRLSETFIGAFSNMKDAVTRLAAEIGDTLMPALTRSMRNLTRLFQGVTTHIRRFKGELVSPEFEKNFSIFFVEQLADLEKKVEDFSLEQLKTELNNLQKQFSTTTPTAIKKTEESFKAIANSTELVITGYADLEKPQERLANGQIRLVKNQKDFIDVLGAQEILAGQAIENNKEAIDVQTQADNQTLLSMEIEKEGQEVLKAKIELIKQLIENFKEQQDIEPIDPFEKMIESIGKEGQLALRFADQLGGAFAQAALTADSFKQTAERAIRSIAATIISNMATFAIMSVFFPTPMKGMKFGEFLFGKLGIKTKHDGGLIQGFANGGMIQGQDNVPILAQAGEFVMQRSAVQSIGLDNLSSMNETGQAGNITVNIHGGIVQEDYLRNELIPAINRSGVRVA